VKVPNHIALSLGIALIISLSILATSWCINGKMKKNANKKNVAVDLPDIVLLYIFTLACLLPFASYAAILFAKYYLSNFLVIEGEMSDWFLIIGAIFTGFITMSAIIFTKMASQKESDKQLNILKEQLEESRKQYEGVIKNQKKWEANQLFPYFLCKLDKERVQFNGIEITIENTSNNPIRLMKVVALYCSEHNITFEKTIILPEFLPPKEKQLILIKVKKIKENMLSVAFNLHLEIEYYDLQENGPYYQIFQVNFKDIDLVVVNNLIKMKLPEKGLISITNLIIPNYHLDGKNVIKFN